MFLFSITNFVNALESNISALLELETGIQESDLNDIYIKHASLGNSTHRYRYNSMKENDKVIKKEILRKIKSKEFSYYKWYDVIRAYSSFIYSVNKLFQLYSYKEKWYNVNSRIKSTLYETKTYYKNLQHLVNR